MKEKIDLNADIGESFGTYKLGEDENIVSFISKAPGCILYAEKPSSKSSSASVINPSESACLGGNVA